MILIKISVKRWGNKTQTIILKNNKSKLQSGNSEIFYVLSYLDVRGHCMEAPGLGLPVTLAGLTGIPPPPVAVHLAPLLWTTSKLTERCFSGGRLGPSWQFSILGQKLDCKDYISLSLFFCISVITARMLITAAKHFAKCEDEAPREQLLFCQRGNYLIIYFSMTVCLALHERECFWAFKVVTFDRHHGEKQAVHSW